MSVRRKGRPRRDTRGQQLGWLEPSVAILRRVRGEFASRRDTLDDCSAGPARAAPWRY